MAARKLQNGDLLYRAVDRRQYDPSDDSLYGAAFADPGRIAKIGAVSDTLSFSADEPATPIDVLQRISNRGKVKRDCDTHPDAPTPRQMFANGYRVALLLADYVIAVCDEPQTDLYLVTDGAGNDVEEDGHVQVYHGHLEAETWAQVAVLLTEAETFGS